MTITASFETWEELVEFAKQVLAKEEPAKVPEPEAVPKQVKAEIMPEPERIEAPAEPEDTAYSMTEVRALLGDLRKNGKKTEVSSLIREMGYSKFVDIPAEKYGELMEKARAL